MRPGIVLDAEPPIASASTSNKYMDKNESMPHKDSPKNNENPKPSINCFAQILLGIKCEINGIDETVEESNEKLNVIQTSSISTEKDEAESDKETQMQGEITETDDDEKIVTIKDGLIPDRDEVFVKKPLFSSQPVPIQLETNHEKSAANSQKLGIKAISKLP